MGAVISASKPTVAKAKPSKAKVTAKAAKTAQAIGRFPDDAIIRVLVKENPRRAGSKRAVRLDKYGKSLKTVADAKKAGIHERNLRFDIAAGVIAIE